ncbi:MAG: hypothetical protein M3406_05965 [Chloroflexota bacterium]|nr:hypothetical protein [Chloroflexota bacterium]
MPDTAVGFVLLGIGILVVLGVVFAISSRGGPTRSAGSPPRGVHLPGPSFLPVVLSLAAALMGAGLAFRGEDQLANPFLAVPGLLILVIGSIAWVRAANHEWRDVEHGSHDDRSAH